MSIQSSAVPSARFPRLERFIGRIAGEWNRIGSQAQFYVAVIGLMPKALVRYRAELVRCIGNMGMGTGALAVIGGAVGVFGVIVMANGILVGVLAANELGSIGVDALTGLAGSVLNLRFMIPGTCIVALTATIGAGATAQLGAMRINEEIDALEVMGVSSVAYLASTQVIAGTMAMVPLYCATAITGFLGTRITTTIFERQGSGVYDHYFNTFFDPVSMVWSFAMTIAMTVIIMLVHTYYGYNASGGPAGVGEAVGRSVRTSLVIAVVGILLISLAVYGQSGSFNLAS